MFRIKPVKNQTVAKHANLSPNPNKPEGNKVINQLNLNKNPKFNIPININATKQKNLINQVLTKNVATNLINPYKTNKPNKFTIHKLANLNKNEISPVVDKNKHRLMLQRKDEGKNIHKIKLQNKQSQLILRKQENKSIQIQEDSKKVAIKPQQIKNYTIQKKIQTNQKIHNQSEEKIQSEKKQQISDINKIIQSSKQSIEQVQIKQQNAPQQLSKIQQQALRQKQNKDKQQNEKQMKDLVIKIQKRRQARQKQKLRIKQLQQKQAQNQRNAVQFLANRNQGSDHQQPSQFGGMLKLNDQLMHFSLAQSVMDLQIKKLLKTNFNQFPNTSQIKYQLQQLQQINLSYEMIKYDENNPLKNGLKNYRVNIFNRIGELIVSAQQQGYSNQNFHILETDGRGRGQNMPEAIRGLPQESMDSFVKYRKSGVSDQCAICLGEIMADEISAQLECKHKFHTTCIQDWVKSSANCPTCRFNIKFGNKKQNK